MKRRCPLLSLLLTLLLARGAEAQALSHNALALTFSRASSTPVIAKGAAYDGMTANGLAAPAVCYDAAKSRWVMLTDMWSAASGKWYNLAFTSRDLVTWTYVAGSRQSPSAADYITGNGGIVKNTADGKFYRSYSHYGRNSVPSNGVFVAWSRDLITWTDVHAGAAVLTPGPAGSGDSLYLCDSSLCFNPNTRQYELWYCGADSSLAHRVILYATSADCLTWTKHGVALTCPAFATAGFGEPQTFYVGRDRCLTFDSGLVSGARTVGMAYFPKSGSVSILLGDVLTPQPGNRWESANVFDSCCVGLADTGDGRGMTLRMLYAGSPILATTDNTQSGIGLASAPLPH